MRKCIYCRNLKDEDEFTLEHVIPQFLGGAYSPDYFKIREVCKQCNNNLGLFVDAGFEKNWLVSNKLKDAAYAFFDPNNSVGLPLICMGKSDLSPPNLEDNEVCESWLGPLGEQIYWIRPHDERLYWFMGGNPITTKNTKSRAYYLFSERSAKDPKISWLSFRDSFEGRRIKKIMCTKVDGANPADIGFEVPDESDQIRIDYFNNACHIEQQRQNQLSFYTHFDLRFLAKFSIGIAYALFGENALQTEYGEVLYKALRHRDGEDIPGINASSLLRHGNDSNFSELTGLENAVTITIMAFPEGILVNLNLGAKLNWTVMCASLENLTEEEISKYRDGIVIVLFRQLKRAVTLPFSKFVLHKTGKILNDELVDIYSKVVSFRNYIENL